MAIFWYNTAVWPISLESSACRMVMNQDGSMQLQMGETEIGQGADTAFAQMAAETLGIPVEQVHVISTQDTDLSPFGTGAYASRQTYVGGFAIRQTALLMKERILQYAQTLTRQAPYNMDIIDGSIVRTTDGRKLMTLGQLATEAIYSLEHSEHITAESTYQIKNNAYSFGCSFAEVEVDIPLCKVKLLDLVNVHDCGRLINPALAEAQVHGGMSMAIGYGLSEQLLFDEKTGKPLNNNLLDYKLSTTMDHPDLAVRFVENYEPTSAYGTKALESRRPVPARLPSATPFCRPQAWPSTRRPLPPMSSLPGSKRKGCYKEGTLPCTISRRFMRPKAPSMPLRCWKPIRRPASLPAAATCSSKCGRGNWRAVNW